MDISNDIINEPEDVLIKKQSLIKIQEAIDLLNEKEQQVMSLLYIEDFNITEIAEILELTKARVSQIHSNALLKIKEKIDNNK